MMNSDILLTSFTTWKPHHASNAGDDLLQRYFDDRGERHRSLRQLPVDFVLAPRRVLEAFEALRPRVIVCCGMAEERRRLDVESRAVLDGRTLRTGLDPVALTEGLPMTGISHDAGRFVCNTLYYRVLEHLHARKPGHHALFLHVPPLTERNAQPLTDDFAAIIERLALL